MSKSIWLTLDHKGDHVAVAGSLFVWSMAGIQTWNSKETISHVSIFSLAQEKSESYLLTRPLTHLRRRLGTGGIIPRLHCVFPLATNYWETISLPNCSMEWLDCSLLLLNSIEMIFPFRSLKLNWRSAGDRNGLSMYLIHWSLNGIPWGWWWKRGQAQLHCWEPN